MAEGIELITLEGDAPAILGMVVHLENNGTFIFTSDGVKSMGNYTDPPTPAGAIYDTLGFVRSVKKIKKLEKKYKARIVFGHDGQHLKQFKLSPEYYD